MNNKRFNKYVKVNEWKISSRILNPKTYKDRMFNEYHDLYERTKKLRDMLNAWDEDKLDFEPTCNYWILEKQFNVMCEYLGVLETRAEIENIDLWPKTEN